MAEDAAGEAAAAGNILHITHQNNTGDIIMNRSTIFGTALALGMAVIIGISGTAFAYPGGHRGAGAMTQEQQAAAQEIYAEHDQKTAPLRQQLMAKRSELDALYYSQNTDSGKAQSLYKEIADIQARLFTANTDLRKKLSDKGIPVGNHGMRGMNCGGMYGGYGMHGGSYGGGGRGMHGGGHW